jgi:hypothetical protein
MAEDAKPKRTLNANMTLKYNVLPEEAKSFGEVFSKAVFYGRLRANSFTWDYNDDVNQVDNRAIGVGGSLVYKTAPFHGVGVNLGAYYTNAVDTLKQNEIGSVKAGKDTFSRYKVRMENDFSLFALAEANIYYKSGKSELKVGQQIFESVFTKSNDTKMIPNTFMGAVYANKSFKGTTFRLAHFTAQKLRDHESNHDVITFNDGTGSSASNWGNNDDSAVHKGLSYANFTAAGKSVDHTLNIVTIKSKIGENLKTELSYLALPDVINNLTLEAHYTMKAGKTKIIPGVRYMMQMDDGGGAIGGASLKGDLNATYDGGYTNKDSLDSSLLCARIDIKPEGNYKYRLGYSKVADKADIVAPWRGFPTGGFTRAMAQYNWIANTETIMARIDGKVSKNVKFLLRYAIQDFDDNKAGAQADTNILHTDWMFNMNTIAKGLEGKIRVGLVSDEDKGTKSDVSYNEYRFELNYLF